MKNIPTPHIQIENKEDIAKTVLMPGDPLRAKFIAENYLTDVKKINETRNMLAYTGYYKNKKVTVFGSGMGMPSIGIYSYELFNFYDVDNIIRIGSAGAFQENLKIGDLIITNAVSTNSNWPKQFDLPGTLSLSSNYSWLEKSVNLAKSKNINYHVGSILSSDIFYDYKPNTWKKWASLGILCVEMEAYALYSNALIANKNAFCLLTISDSLVTNESMPAIKREQSFNNMMEIALEIA